MEIIFNLPDELGKQFKAQPDGGNLVIEAVQIFLERQIIARKLAESSIQADQGEYASEESMNVFWSKWSQYEG